MDDKTTYSEIMLTKEYQDIKRMETKLGMDMSGLMMFTFESWVKNKETKKDK